MKELHVCFEAARAGAAVIMKYYGKKFAIKHKGIINLVTEVDEKSQKAICAVIQKYFKKDAILAEEEGRAQTHPASRRWIVDPIDGTTNFAHGYPKFCVSIAFEKEGVLQCGVIFDPVMKEVFTAQKGHGAFLNKKRISVSKISHLKQALLVTGFPYDLYNPEYDNRSYFIHMLDKAQAIRRDGSAALNLAYVACGRFDGFWEFSLNPWDIATGVLLIEEAGGIVRHISGRPFQLLDHALIGSNPRIYKDFQKEIKAVKK